MTNKQQILIYGYGNPGRQDDGLGSLLIEKAEKWVDKSNLSNITLDVNFQLQVEDVTIMQDKDLILFVDASMDETVSEFKMVPVQADPRATFTMHAVSPEYLLALCRKVYGKNPPAYLLHIRGYEWNLDESLTPSARQNLENAWSWLRDILSDPEKLEEIIERTATTNPGN